VEGLMTVDGESGPVRKYDCIYLSSRQKHTLQNTGSEDMQVMFVYAPKIIVDHWDKELKGEIR
jgi:mannose-6-phosphate isomerase-like protein (cupin superfamily)